jgi:hypothetical protein
MRVRKEGGLRQIEMNANSEDGEAFQCCAAVWTMEEGEHIKNSAAWRQNARPYKPGVEAFDARCLSLQ